jgi:seryl-tRNA synthetase
MLDIKFIRENADSIKQSCKNKKVGVDIDRLLNIDKDRKELKQKLEKISAEKNKASKEISLAKDDNEKRKEIIAGMQSLDKEADELKEKLENVEKEFNALMIEVPNVCCPDVPFGEDEQGNKVIKKWGTPPKFDFKPKDHMELGEALGIIDTKKASEITGARFGYLKGAAALLEYALLQYVFSILTSEKTLKKIAQSVEKGYSAKPFVPAVPPVMIRPDIFKKMARLSEQDKDERYYLPQDDLYLIGSAEHTLGPLHMNEIIDEKDLPIRYVGFSTSFRREAGSYGKDTKGILRVHQFDKIEMESFTLPENSVKEQNFFVAIQEYLVRSLEIPYQVVMICSGDMGRPDARQIDIECWMPGQNKYRETHTSDLMTDYQARRLNIRTRRKNGKTEFVHMNDATAFAIGRILIAILENYQQKDGSVEVPKVLQKGLGLKKIKKNG